MVRRAPRRPDRFLTEANFARLAAIREARDPDGRFCSWLIDDDRLLNVEPPRRRA